MGVGAGAEDDLAKVASGMPEEARVRGAVQLKMNNGARFCGSARAQRRFTDFFLGGHRGSESTKAFFTTDREWMGNGWDLKQPVWGFIGIVSV